MLRLPEDCFDTIPFIWHFPKFIHRLNVSLKNRKQRECNVSVIPSSRTLSEIETTVSVLAHWLGCMQREKDRNVNLNHLTSSRCFRD